MDYKVTAPVETFTGTVAGAVFVDGTATVPASNTAALRYFARRGYTVEGGKPASPKRPAGNAAKADWQSYAIALGLPEDEVEQATTKELQELTKES